MSWTEAVGLIAGFLTTIGMIPQVWRLFRLHSAHEISLSFVVSFVVGIAFWLLYGILNGLFAVIFWNALNLLLCMAMLYAKLKWGMIKKTPAPAMTYADLVKKITEELPTESLQWTDEEIRRYLREASL